MKILLIGAMIAALGGCAFLSDTVDDINTPENREKAAKVLVKAADGSCKAAAGYLQAVGPQLESSGAEYIADLKEICVEAQSLPEPTVTE